MISEKLCILIHLLFSLCQFYATIKANAVNVLFSDGSQFVYYESMIAISLCCPPKIICLLYCCIIEHFKIMFYVGFTSESKQQVQPMLQVV